MCSLLHQLKIPVCTNFSFIEKLHKLNVCVSAFPAIIEVILCFLFLFKQDNYEYFYNIIYLIIVELLMLNCFLESNLFNFLNNIITYFTKQFHFVYLFCFLFSFYIFIMQIQYFTKVGENLIKVVILF